MNMVWESFAFVRGLPIGVIDHPNGVPYRLYKNAPDV